jgi:outer membrane PBP1 activator LpoA protein
MHPQLNSRMKLLSIVIGAALLASCASAPSRSPAEVEARDIIVEEPITTEVDGSQDDDLTTPLENRFDDKALQAEELNVSRAEYYSQQAQIQDSRYSQVDSILSAAEYYIQAQDFEAAERAAGELYYDALDTVQADRRTVINAYVAYSRGQHVQTISLLIPLWSRVPDIEIVDDAEIVSDSRTIDGSGAVDGSGLVADAEPLPTIPEPVKLSTQQVDALLLGSFSFQALGDYDSAIAALIQRERSLVGSTRSETTRYIWQVINALPVARRQMIFDSSQNMLVRNRVEQSLTTVLAPIPELPQQFTQWREEPENLSKQTLDHTWNNDSPRSIAVLLPITSKYSVAAQAVRDGIDYQHNANRSPYRPLLRYYDIGDNPYLSTQYYAAAIQSGADFIIGPLGKDYANQISSYAGNGSSTLLLGGDTPLSPSTSRFSMSPEMEGARVAERAWKDGHLSAALLVTDTDASHRTVAAFSQKWRNLGGKVSDTVTYSPRQYDHSVELKQLFDVNQSEYRHKQISSTLGFKPEFTAYQRSDIDFILMIADTETGRLILPQVNFFSGSNIPVYSTSAIFNGLQDKVNNIDLDGTRFPVMPWVLKSAEVAPYAGQLNMLFALGTDAYRVASSYKSLRQNSELAINGNTGQVSINTYGETIYQPVWATFQQGEVVAIETLGIDLAPLQTPNGGILNSQNVNGIYNDSNYNSQTWDQQNGARKRAPVEDPKNQQDDLRRSR